MATLVVTAREVNLEKVLSVSTSKVVLETTNTGRLNFYVNYIKGNETSLDLTFAIIESSNSTDEFTIVEGANLTPTKFTLTGTQKSFFYLDIPNFSDKFIINIVVNGTNTSGILDFWINR